MSIQGGPKLRATRRRLTLAFWNYHDPPYESSGVNAKPDHDLVKTLQSSTEVCSRCRWFLANPNRAPLSPPSQMQGAANQETNSWLPPCQSDVSRAKTLELAIQSRVGEELKKLAEKELVSIREAQERLSAEAEAAAATPPEQLKGPSRHTVSEEIETLRAKLEERRRLKKVPEELVKARADVIRCLRENDRRPLDCWGEVERFKGEVKKMEQGWFRKVTS